ncbi:hypothetical protein Tco_0415155, partial [Tanacetum coccineum]
YRCGRAQSEDDRLYHDGSTCCIETDVLMLSLLYLWKKRLYCEAWVQSMDASDTTRSKVRALRTTVLAQQTEIAALRAVDRARQAQLVETLRLMSTLQTQVTALKGQQGPVSGPTQPEIPKEAGNSS